MEEREKMNGGEAVNILYAEDRTIFRKSLAELLLSRINSPINVLQAHDGFEALEILKEKPVYLILSDINMPRVSGYTLAAIRYLQLHPHADLAGLAKNEWAGCEINTVIAELDDLRLRNRRLLDDVLSMPIYNMPFIAMTAEYEPLKLALLTDLGVNEIARKEKDITALSSLVEQYLPNSAYDSRIPVGNNMPSTIIRMKVDGQRQESYMILPRQSGPTEYLLFSQVMGASLSKPLAWHGARYIQEKVDAMGAPLTHEVGVSNKNHAVLQTLSTLGYQEGPGGRFCRTFTPSRRSS